MSKLTIAEAAQKLNVSKEAIHNRIRRGSLKSVIENDIKYVILDKTVKTSPRATVKKILPTHDERYYKLLEEQNTKLQNRVEKLEDETRSLRDQKEQMLIDERKKIEQIYKDKDEQLKNILSAFSSKLMLNAPETLEKEENIELVDIELEESTVPKNKLISLNKYLKQRKFSKKKQQKIKDKFKKNAKADGRIITIGKKHYIDLVKYDYSDFSL